MSDAVEDTVCIEDKVDPLRNFVLSFELADAFDLTWSIRVEAAGLVELLRLPLSMASKSKLDLALSIELLGDRLGVVGLDET